MNRQKSFLNEEATLYLVATPIGNLSELTPRAIEILESVDVIAAEDTRTTSKLLSHFNIHTKLMAHHLHNEKESTKGLIKLLEANNNIALVSDAGYPVLSDPGQQLVNAVIEAGFNVVPISGANAAINAVVASGIAAQPFTFYGFMGSSEKERIKTLTELKDFPFTLIFYEAPHRIKKTLTNMLDILGDRKICLAKELTKRYEEFIRGNISEIIEICDELKGEMVIVVEAGQKEEVSVSPQLLKKKIDQMISEGYSTKDAIKSVAKEYGISKNDLYNDYHGLN